MATGPLPVPSGGREHRVHNACGGAGCPVCRFTGYGSMGPPAIRRAVGRLCSGEEPRVEWLPWPGGGPPPPPAPAPSAGASARAPSAQLSLVFD